MKKKKGKKGMLDLMQKAETAKTRKKAQKIIKKFYKKFRGESLRPSGANTPKPLAITQYLAVL